MKVLTWLLLLGAVFVTPVRAEEKPDDKAAVKKLQGTWRSTKLTYNGKEHSVEGDKAIFLVFKGKEVTIRASEEVKKEYARAQVTLDPAAKPAIMDFLILAGSQKDVAMEGIYKIEDDKLTLCVRVVGTDRPVKFEAPEGESVALLELEREKE